MSAGGAGQLWLAGGETLTAGTQSFTPGAQSFIPGVQSFTPGAATHVAVWSATSPAGPWRANTMEPVPGRDGPFEAILGFARRGAQAVAFGSRPSPGEGYPRPSTWLSAGTGGVWQEQLENREFFGGPYIVGLGGITAGPHGFTIAGTWSHFRGHAIATVWQSDDGTQWRRNDQDPSFAGAQGEIPFANDVADNTSGLLLAGTADAPDPARPTYQRGAIWYSTSGARWQRLFAADANLNAGPRTVLSAVRDQGSGWIIGGTRGASGGERPFVWVVNTKLELRAMPLPIPSGHKDAAVSGVAVSSNEVVAVGVADGGPAVWEAPLVHGAPGRWRSVNAPRGPALPGLRRVVVAASRTQVVVTMVNGDASQIWRAVLAAGSPS
ncbi:MAG: hypothetical protein ACR2NJ_03390 [Acidimicrobiales bacterium]